MSAGIASGVGWFAVLFVIALAVVMSAYREGFMAQQTRGTTATELGRLRCLITGVTLFYVVVWEGSLPETAELPRELLEIVGSGFLQETTSVLVDWSLIASSAGMLAALKWTTAALLLMAMVGIATRPALLLGTLGYFFIGGIMRSYSHLFHTGLVPLYLLVVLVLVPCADGFTLVRRRQASRPIDAAVYGFARYTLWVVLALCYVMAGLSKLRVAGVSWASPDNLRSIIALDNLNPMQIEFGLGLALLGAPDILWWLLGASTLVVEVSYVAVLWSRTARALIPLLAAAMHVGIMLLQNVIFLDLIVLQLIFFELGALPRLIPVPSARKVPEAGRVTRYAFALLLWVIVSVEGAVWLGWVSKYPFSPFAMYATLNTEGSVSYYRLLGQDGQGALREVRLDDHLPAFRDARYRDLLYLTFEDGRDDPLLNRAYRKLAKSYLVASEQSDLVRLEVQRRIWDFSSDPDDPEHGRIVERYTILLTREQGS